MCRTICGTKQVNSGKNGEKHKSKQTIARHVLWAKTLQAIVCLVWKVCSVSYSFSCKSRRKRLAKKEYRFDISVGIFKRVQMDWTVFTPDCKMLAVSDKAGLLSLNGSSFGVDNAGPVQNTLLEFSNLNLIPIKFKSNEPKSNFCYHLEWNSLKTRDFLSTITFYWLLNWFLC